LNAKKLQELVMFMAKKMAVRTSQKTTKRSLDFSGLKKLKKLSKGLALTAGIVVVLIGLSQLPKSWEKLWPVEIIAFVNPAEQIKQVDIAKLLEQQKMTGMLNVDVSKLRQILLTNPWIKDIEIKKHWPNKLVFELSEYQVLAKVNERLLLANGALVESSPMPIKAASIALEIKTKEAIVEDKLLELVSRLTEIQDILELQSMKIDYFSINVSKSWSLITENQLEIKIGRKQQVERVKRLSSVLSTIRNNKMMQSIDLRYSNGVAVKYVTETAAKEQKG
jgi:cell division protein FtsQ